MSKSSVQNRTAQGQPSITSLKQKTMIKYRPNTRTLDNHIMLKRIDKRHQTKYAIITVIREEGEELGKNHASETRNPAGCC